MGHASYVGPYVKTDVLQPHTFQDVFESISAGGIDEAQYIVRLESLVRPMNDHGCSFDDFSKAHAAQDLDFLTEFCEVWNSKCDLRPAFSTLLSEVVDALERKDWPDRLRDILGLAHYSPSAGPEPVVLCKYSIKDISREAKTKFPMAMPTVLDSTPWEHYFPAPGALQCGRAMALTPCETENDLRLEFLHSRVTYSPNMLWKVGQIVTPGPHTISMSCVRCT